MEIYDKNAMRKRFKSLHRQNRQMLDYKLERIIESGCLNLDKYEDDYQLPKLIMALALETLAEQWKPLYPDNIAMKKLEVIKNFL